MAETMSFRSSLTWTGQVAGNWARWTRGHWRMTLILSVAAFVVGWVWNTYIMAVDLEGSVVGPDTETSATAEGHTGNVVYWLILFSLIAGVISYAWSRGWRAFGSDLLTLPRRFGQAMAQSPAAALGMLLWGMSISLIISTLISSAVSAVLGLALLALAATPLGVVLNFALIRVWRGLTGIVAPNASARLAGMVSPFMVMVGEALGLFVDWAVGVWIIGLVLGIACAVGSVLIVRGVPAPRASAALFVLGAVVAMQAFRISAARADDGGWSECATSDGSPCTGIGGIFAWIVSPGADVVIARGTVGGIGAAFGAVLGAGLGAAVAGLAAATAQASAASVGVSGGSTDQPPGGAGAQQFGGAGAEQFGGAGAQQFGGAGAEPHIGEQYGGAHVGEQYGGAQSGQQGAYGADSPADGPRIPHQESWPPAGADTFTTGGVDVPAHVDTSGAPGEADVDAARSLAGGGEGSSRFTPPLDIDDLLPEEPEKKRRDTDAEGQPEPPPTG